MKSDKVEPALIREFEMEKTEMKKRPYNLRSRTTIAGLFTKKSISTILIMLTWSSIIAVPILKQAGHQGLNLGKLYDCTNRRMVTTLDNPSIDYCDHRKNVTRIMTADVFEFEQKTKTIPIYLCFAQKHGLWCDVGFFGDERHWSVNTRVPVSQKECETAHKNRITNYGPLVKIKYDRYRTTNKLTFECPWPRKTVKYVMEFEYTIYKAKVTADEPVLIQSVTETHCQVRDRH